MRLFDKMQTVKAKRIAIVFAVTIAVGWVGAKILYDRVVFGNDARNECIKNLEWIDGAKRIAAEEHGLKSGAIVGRKDLEPYLEGWRDCPAGGRYMINPIGTGPTCSIAGHRLPK